MSKRSALKAWVGTGGFSTSRRSPTDSHESRVAYLHPGIWFPVTLACLLLIFIPGCATDYKASLDWHFGEVIYDRVPQKQNGRGTCVIQARIYRWYLGRGAKVMSNGEHAFVVKDGLIYDSTQMQFTGYPSDNVYVEAAYGPEESWFEIE